MRELGADVAHLLATEDVDAIAADVENDSIAAVLVWENAWAAPFASSIRRAGGQLVETGRIPMQAIVAVLEATAEATAATTVETAATTGATGAEAEQAGPAETLIGRQDPRSPGASPLRRSSERGTTGSLFH